MRVVVPPKGANWRSLDVLAVAILFMLCVAAAMLRAIYDDWLAGYDTLTYYLSSFGYLGDRLRDGQIPAWNPYFSSGAPMAGDPQGGWMYLPVMFAFTLFKAVTAFKVLLLLLSVIGGLGLYVFARRISLSPIPALFASVAFAIGPIAYGTATDRIIIVLTYPAMAVGLCAAEMALRSNRTIGFLSWTALGGLALSQNFASYPTQGTLYTLMYVAGWLAYRWLVAPIPEVGPRLTHLKRAVMFGIGMGVIAVAFGGAALWPVLDYTNQSPLAGGDYSKAVQGDDLSTPPILNLLAVMLQDSSHYRLSTTSGAVVLLVLFALALGRNRYGIPYFAVAAWLFIDLASTEFLTMRAFYVVPMFERIHSHRPSVASAFIYPAILLVAAGGLQLLIDGIRTRRLVWAVSAASGVFAGFIAICWSQDIPIGAWPIATAVVAAILILLCALPIRRISAQLAERLPQLSAAILVIILLIYPTAVDYTRIMNGTGHTPGLEDVDPATDDVEWVVNTTAKREDHGTAAEFLQQQRDLQQPFRFASYYGADTASGQHVPFVYRRFDREIVLTLAGSRAGFLGLQDISGYNPIHLTNYVEYFKYMQGKEQNYHFVDVFYQALDTSQLFAMLNVRYVLVATTNLGFNPPITLYGREVFRDAQVIVYENPYAFPRAWIVHVVGDNKDGEGLLLLNSGMVDGHQVAYVDGPLPEVEPLTGSGPADAVTVTSYAPERIEMTASSSASGLLVVSEVYANGWNASVDGEQVEILRTNHALRGVPLPAGEHTVVMTYEPRSLTIGLWSTGLTSIAMLGIWFWALVDWRRRGGTSSASPHAVAASREDQRESRGVRLTAAKRLLLLVSRYDSSSMCWALGGRGNRRMLADENGRGRHN